MMGVAPEDMTVDIKIDTSVLMICIILAVVILVVVEVEVSINEVLSRKAWEIWVLFKKFCQYFFQNKLDLYDLGYFP